MKDTLEMKPSGFWDDPVNLSLSLQHMDIDEEEAIDDDIDEQHATKIKQAKSKKKQTQWELLGNKNISTKNSQDCWARF
jgi:hypothetical protein